MLPVFPLPVVVFPSEEIRLHIYEERYKQMIADCDKKNIPFVILPFIHNQVQDRGSLMILTEIRKKYEDGRMDIIATCSQCCQLKKFYLEFPKKLYSGVEIELNEEFSESDSASQYQELKTAFQELCSLNSVQPYHAVVWDQFVSYKIAHYVGFNLEEEYALFCIDEESKRIEKLIDQIHHLIQQTKQRQDWIQRLNMNGEFRFFN